MSEAGMHSKRTATRRVCAAVAVLVIGFTTVPPTLADPPPWAPAHGWRAKHDKHHHDVAYIDRVDGNIFRCNSDAVGAAIGAVAGGAIGSTVKGSGRTAAIIGGAVLGAIIGGHLGREVDKVDRACTAQGLTRLKDGEMIRWENTQTRRSYALRPISTYSADDGRVCRRYVIQAGGDDERYERLACRGDDDVWHVPG
ncbi:glycine zipper domain-containing protein [Limibacillus halophilus]|uniref:Surface antigen n=1 Tax=Limibacillus halophilus TaxID=1579333 RepID=A0A839SS07_9PROT|nr:glycine zipper domain-containing protein [Limibacillus halophilus]MBB3064759.1 surface antigen [Limibacillus halophilus]